MTSRLIPRFFQQWLCVFDITRDHGELLEQVFDLVVPGGIVWFSTNARRFRLDEQVASRAHVIEMTGQPIPDFRQRPHRSGDWRKMKSMNRRDPLGHQRPLYATCDSGLNHAWPMNLRA